DLTGLLVADDRAARHADDEVRAVLALAALAAAVFARRGDVFFLVAEVHQRGQVVIHLEDDRAAAAAVAAVRPAGGDILLAVEADLAVPALAGDDLDLCNIDKHGLSSFPERECFFAAPAPSGQSEAGGTGAHCAPLWGGTSPLHA